jgi:hypothetical protein
LNLIVRLSDDAIRWARIDSGYTGESMAEYVSRMVAERGKQDADRIHAEMSTGLSKPSTASSKTGAKSKERRASD